MLKLTFNTHTSSVQALAAHAVLPAIVTPGVLHNTRTLRQRSPFTQLSQNAQVNQNSIPVADNPLILPVLSSAAYSSHTLSIAPKLKYTNAPQAEEPGYHQLSNINVPVSDHNLYVIDLAIETIENGEQILVARTPDNRHLPVTRIAVLNMMMQGRERKGGYNNAYALHEDKEQYLARVELIIQRLAALIARDSKIDMLMLQEAPIGQDVPFVEACFKKYFQPLPKQFEVNLKGTAWGIMVIANTNVFPHVLDKLIIHDQGVMKDRLVTVEFPDLNTSVSVLHAPHAQPLEATRPVEQNMSSFFQKRIDQGAVSATCACVGDWNIDPDHPEIQSMPRRAVENLIPNGVPHACESTFFVSKDGHRDASGQNKTVDFMAISTVRLGENPRKVLGERTNRQASSPIL